MTQDETVAALVKMLFEIEKADSAATSLSSETTRLAEQLIALTPDLETDMQVRHVLAWWHWLRHHALPDDEGETDLCEAAILAKPLTAHPEAAELGVLRYAFHLNALGTELAVKHEQTQDLTTLHRAIALVRTAAESTWLRHPNAPLYRANLSAVLRTLFEQTGARNALNEAFEHGRIACALVEPQLLAKRFPDRNLASILNSYAMALFVSFGETGQTEALEEAVNSGRDAVDAMPLDDPQRPALLSNLSLSLQVLFTRAGRRELLAEAMEIAQEAVSTTPPTDLRLAGELNNLANVMQLFYEGSQQPDAARRTLEARRAALDMAVPGHPARGLCLANLARTLTNLPRSLDNPDVLEESVQVAREAVMALRGHADHADALAILGLSLRLLFDRSGGTAALMEARQSLTEAATATSASATTRVAAARAAAEADLLAEDSDHALTMIELAVALLLHLADRRLDGADREFQITHLTGLPSVAAGAAIAAGRPERACELLEQTRGILLSSILDTRGDINDLRHDFPDLAAEFDQLRREIDAASHTRTISSGTDDRARQHRQAERRITQQNQWAELLDRIRAHDPQLSGFLMPQSIDQLCRQAAAGPIVYVTVHGDRGNALIVTDRAVEVVDLPGLTQSMALIQIGRLHDAHQQQLLGDQTITRVLSWLWDTVTGPVLNHLGYATTPRDEELWPHVWWCPVGTLNYLPLHAAGHHADPRTPGVAVVDRVVSSYTPTIAALAHARMAPESGLDGSLAIIVVPHAPGTLPLAGVTDEARRVRELVPDATEISEPVGHDAATAAMEAHQIVHFACHATTDWANPSESRLILDDHLDHPLTVADIARLRLDNAQLAYLSACDTTVTSADHADEATHLAAAFQLAGYRHVVGTLWPVIDFAATRIARRVYQHLTGNGTTPPDPGLAAQALHRAIRAARDQDPAKPRLWGGHTHTGP